MLDTKHEEYCCGAFLQLEKHSIRCCMLTNDLSGTDVAAFV